MNNFIFIGQFVTKEYANNVASISQAGNNYVLKLIQLLEPNIAISLYPIFIRDQKVTSVNSTKYIRIYRKTKLPYKLHIIYRFLFDTLQAFKIVAKSKIDNVFVYNIDKQNALLIWMVKKLLRRKTYVIVADHWSYLNKSFFEKFSNALLMKLDGAVVLNSNIKINPNQVVLPGLLIEDDLVFKKEGKLNRNVLFSGSLGETTGLLLVLDCFSKNPDFSLYITGRPYKMSKQEFDSIINDYVGQYPNIHYLGLLAYEDYLDLLDLCDICLSLRNPEDVEHQFNFPSKILEYLSKSKIVVSSIKYNDIHEDLLMITEFNSGSLKSILNKVSNLSEQRIMEHRLLTYNYLLGTFCKESLQHAVLKLIN